MGIGGSGKAARRGAILVLLLLGPVLQGREWTGSGPSLGASLLRIALATPRLSQVKGASVDQDFTRVLTGDLSLSGAFRVVQPPVDPGTRPETYPAWSRLGADWLLVTRLVATGDELHVRVSGIDLRTSRSVFQKAYRGSRSVLRRIAHALSDELVERRTGRRGIASSRILFSREERAGVKDIWQVDADGAHPLRLTNHLSLTRSPAVAPDGRLAYVTYKGGSPAIWGQHKPGGPQELLVPLDGRGPCFGPAWSPDGKRLAYGQVTDRKGNADLHVLDLESGSVRRLTRGLATRSDPAWSPSGASLAFTSDRDGTPRVFIVNLDGTLRSLTPKGASFASPAWSPSGRLLAYVSLDRPELVVHHLAEDRAVPFAVGARPESPSFSPDGRRIVFSGTGPDGTRLYTTGLAGEGTTLLTDLPGCESPRWTGSR